MEEVNKMEENRVFCKDLLSLLGMGAESEKVHKKLSAINFGM